MSVINTLRFILQHPLNRGMRLRAIRQYLAWQVAARLSPGAIAVPFAESTRLLVKRGQAGATGNLYGGLHELSEMAFTVHLLRAGDLFVDVGANVGSYVILAAGVAGAEVMAFEPGPAAYLSLAENVRLNGLGGQVDCRQTAVGDVVGEVRMTVGQDATNRVLDPDSGEESTIVPVTTLDSELGGRSPVLIKIDTEGFENRVIGGAPRVLASDSLLAVIVEAHANPAGGTGVPGDFRRDLEARGFSPFLYDPFSRRLTRHNPGWEGNRIWVRDPDAVSNRLRTASPFRVAGRGPL
jgi:FkbM family methyltransferase